MQQVTRSIFPWIILQVINSYSSSISTTREPLRCNQSHNQFIWLLSSKWLHLDFHEVLFAKRDDSKSSKNLSPILLTDYHWLLVAYPLMSFAILATFKGDYCAYYRHVSRLLFRSSWPWILAWCTVHIYFSFDTWMLEIRSLMSRLPIRCSQHNQYAINVCSKKKFTSF